MPIFARKPESTFTACPEGLHHAVCVDVCDLGIVKGAFGDKYKVRIVWQIEEENETRRRYTARKQYNLTLHEKATLRKDLEAWRGQKFTEEQLKGFDLEKLIGVSCQIQVVHDLSDEGTVYANVQAVVPAPKNTTKLVPLDYTREKDKPKDQGNRGRAGSFEEEDDIPFLWLAPWLVPALWATHLLRGVVTT